MRTPVKKFFLPSKNEQVTLAQLKHLDRKVQLEAMREWFHQEFESPDELPYDSGEGGYQWIWGGPYDAEEQLQDAFGGSVDDELIEELASDLIDIAVEWSGKPDQGDFDDDYIMELIASGADPFLTLLSSLTDIESTAKIKAGGKEQKTLHKLLFANIITALETFLGDLFTKTLSTDQQYLEDFVVKTPHFQNTLIKLSSIFERLKKIEAEVRTYVSAHNWHMLKESGQMYKRAFGIRFPDASPTVGNGIRERHNIVHRNGKSLDGAEGAWALDKILQLKAAVLEFAGDIDSQIKKLRPKGSADATTSTGDDPLTEF